jgi:hypothetical protein
MKKFAGDFDDRVLSALLELPIRTASLRDQNRMIRELDPTAG